MPRCPDRIGRDMIAAQGHAGNLESERLAIRPRATAPLSRLVSPMKSATYRDAGRSYISRGAPELLDPSVAHQGDPVGHGERLFLVVGDVDERDAELPVELLELELHLLPQLEVERARAARPAAAPGAG